MDEKTIQEFRDMMTGIVSEIQEKYDPNPNRYPKGHHLGGHFAPKDGKAIGKGKETGKVGRVSASEKISPDDYLAVRDRMPAKYRAMLTPHTKADLEKKVGEGDRILGFDTNGDGTKDVVYILSKDGDIQGVINTGETKGAGALALKDAIGRGGRTLDCFAGFLDRYYAKFGFTEIERLEFDPQYAPPNWNFKKFDHPDVVMMGL